VKLTRRQQDFLGKFIDLYREFRKPVHYSLVARRLGIGNVTAYEMLRLLEERGLVACEYVSTSKGPGRSSVLFYPTRQAFQVLRSLVGEDWDTKEWEEVKARLLKALEEGRGGDYEDLLNQILLRIPERKSPLLYTAELITAVILTIYGIRERAEAQGIFRQLRKLGFPGEIGLNALAGLMLGLSLVEQVNRRLTSLLLSYAEKYQAYLAELNAESKRALADFAGEVMRIVGV